MSVFIKTSLSSHSSIFSFTEDSKLENILLMENVKELVILTSLI